MADLGPISASLQREVKREVERQGIVVWLDRDNHFSHFVDAWIEADKTGAASFPIVAFRGSFLELLLALENYGNGLGREALLVHMPGFHEDLIKTTPMLEMYEAGVRYRKSLDTLIREAAHARVAPAEVEAFLGKAHTLEEADRWLSGLVSQRAGGLAAMLDDVGQTLLVQALAGVGGVLAAKTTTPDDLGVLRGYAHKLTGMDDAWIAQMHGNPQEGQRDGFHALLDALGAWLLCVEYVHDLRRPPHMHMLKRLRDLPTQLVKTCAELLVSFRGSYGDVYAERANDVELLIAAEIAAMTPDDLGQIDTFAAEDKQMLEGTVQALQDGAFGKARVWCDARHGERSFWLLRDQKRRWVWSLAAEAAAFGETIERYRRPLANIQNLELAVERYASGAFEVDRAHRRFEQKRLVLLESTLPHFGPLQEVAVGLRRLYRTWVNELCLDFTIVCKEQGFLPPPSLQQRTLFEQVVLPLIQSGEKVAMFVIDAFRFEMATELLDELGGGSGVVDLKPRLAELPTITSVGMNALAPVSQNGKLVVAAGFQGFKTGEYTVKRPADRARAMGMRASGKEALLLTLAEVYDSTTPTLTKRVAQHGLLIVHSKEIDDAGEANVGLPTFEATLRQIKAAWHHLQLAGVNHFVFTADHGFLLQDETIEEIPWGDKEERSRRHVLSEAKREEAGVVAVPVASLGYEGVSGYIVLRKDTAVFSTGTPGATFVHGGNSPEERIIPVLTVTKKRAESGSLAEYMVETEPMQAMLGLNRLRIRAGFAKNTSTGLDFAAARVLDIGIRVPGRPDIQVMLKDVSAPAVLQNGRIKLPRGEVWTEVFFALLGPNDERARVEVHHPDNLERVTPSFPETWFAVNGSAIPTSKTPENTTTPTQGASFADNIADEGLRKVFLHIQKYGVVTETELTTLLGSPRAVRRFSTEIDQHLGKLPFRIRIEPGEGGKRYVREGDR